MVTQPEKVHKRQTVIEDQRICNPLVKRLYTLKEAAKYLGRSEWSMRELIWAGRISVVREEEGRKIFLDIVDLMEYVERNKSTYD